MKLKKVLSRRDKDINREYFRYDITIPNEVIENELKWKKDEELSFKIQGKKLIIEKEKA